MRWIRRHIQSGAWLAQMALALHLILTFGHLHAEQYSPAWMAVAATGTHAGDDGSAPEPRYRAVHHYCAVCGSISLLGVSVVPVAQALVPRRGLAGIIKPDFTDATPLLELRSSFRARAPPSA